MDLCRDTYGYFNTTIFQYWTCSLCFHYLFQAKRYLKPNWNREKPRLVKYFNNVTHQELIPDFWVKENVDLVCKHLQNSDCDRWIRCCKSAVKCCLSQQRHEKSVSRNETDRQTCPETWDGFGCFTETYSNSVAQLPCPDYIEHGFATGRILGDSSI